MALKIGEFRRVVDALRWTRDDISGHTRSEFFKRKVDVVLEPKINEVKALLKELKPRFTTDRENAVDQIESAEKMIADWVFLHKEQGGSDPVSGLYYVVKVYDSSWEDEPIEISEFFKISKADPSRVVIKKSHLAVGSYTMTVDGAVRAHFYKERSEQLLFLLEKGWLSVSEYAARQFVKKDKPKLKLVYSRTSTIQ